MVVSITDKRNKCIISSMIYLILVLAVFSDTLRFPGSAITFFRLSLPLAVVIIGMYPYWMKRFVLLILVFTSIAVVQSILFYKVFHTELSPVPNYFWKMLFWYICIFVVCFLIKILQVIQGPDFQVSFVKFVLYIGMILLIINIANSLLPRLFSMFELDNPNNYGSYIAAMFPFLLVKGYEERGIKNFLGIALALTAIYLCDAKAALFGCVIQIGIWFILVMTNSKRNSPLLCRCGLVMAMVLLVAIIFILNPSINGYRMQGLLMEPILRFIKNDPYPVYTTSIMYRTNTIIFAFWEIVKTGAIGIGIGNTGVVLKSAFPNLNPEYTLALNSPILSLHNTWLEVALDIGIIAIISYGVVIAYALKLFFWKVEMTQVEKIRLLYILSFPIWILGPSGIYTMYFLFITMAFLVFVGKDATLFRRRNFNEE